MQIRKNLTFRVGRKRFQRHKEDMSVLPSFDLIQKACSSMPLFPLPRVVLFPGTLLRLHVFEPRYVQLLEHVQEGNGLFAIPMLRSDSLSIEEPDLHSVAGIGKVVHCTSLPDNRFQIVLLGVGRIQILEEKKTDTLYRVAKGALLSEESKDFDIVPLQQLLTQIIMRNPALSETWSTLLDESLPQRTFLNTVAEILISKAEEKQAFLEIEEASKQGDLLSEKLAEFLLQSI